MAGQYVSPEVLVETRRRHPEWYPTRPMVLDLETLPSTSDARAEELRVSLEPRLKYLLLVHDTRRRGRPSSFSSWFEEELPGFRYGVMMTSMTDSAAATPVTFAIVSELDGSEACREASCAWRMYTFGGDDRPRPAVVCSNPACPLVRRGLYGRLKTCTGCGRAKYCLVSCQRAHWRAHRAECRAAAHP